MYIYKITNLLNNKIYIGQTTKTIEQRFNKHISEAKCEIKGIRPNNYFHNALNKYGAENFTIEILEEVSTIEELNRQEAYWINKLRATNKDIGYNLMAGGTSGEKTQETKNKITIRKKKNWEDKVLAKRMKSGLIKATLTWQQLCKERRHRFMCQVCGKELYLPKWEAEQRIYCSRKCASTVNAFLASRVASEVNSKIAYENRKKLKKEIIEWSIKNRELILNCPKNKISTELTEITNIAERYDITDWRTISKSVCGNYSRKDLLLYLQRYIENVC